MTGDRNRCAMELFEQLVDAPVDERVAKLDGLCADDAELRTLVEAMLAADARTDALLAGGALCRSEAFHTNEPERDMNGRRLGAWKIVRAIGRGGMGTVYEAQRDDGAYTQRAALKLIRGSADSPLARARFLRERQLLAQLRHPHIASLLDGGFTTDGEPYFVMDYVDGMAVDQWCDAQKLDLSERIGLFLQILDAVAYAHRNLVVHRDLKPSNLLVDTAGQVRLLDFGIAKELETGDATATDDRALTFEYASPEQLHAAPITTATDIWQLGVVLHRLLSGAHPFGLSRDTPLSKQIRLLEREPESLARAAAQASVETAALRGGLTPDGLAGALRGALSNVVRGCLSREAEHGYPSVEALADDLRRWLDDRPLRIVPPGRRVRFRLWLRRNRLPAAAAAAVLLAILGGSGVALWQAQEARQQARIAERESATSREALAFLTNTLAAAAPENALSTEVSVRELLDHARANLDARGTADPEVRQAVQRMLGRLYGSLGDSPLAAELLEAGTRGVEPETRDEAIALADDLSARANALALLGRGRDSLALEKRSAALRTRFAPDDLSQRLKAQVALGAGHYHVQQHDIARKHWESAIALSKHMRNPPMDVVDAYQMLSGLLGFQGEYAAARQRADQGLAFLEAHDGSPVARVNLLRQKSQALDLAGDYTASEQVIRQAIAVQRQAVGEGGDRMKLLYNNLGISLNSQGRYREALEALEHAGRLGEETQAPPIDKAITLTNLGAIYENAGDYGRALDYFERSLVLAGKSELSADDPARRMLKRNHARGLMLAGRFPEADVRLRDLEARARRIDGEDSAEYAFTVWQRAVLARRMGDVRGGMPLLEQSRALWRKLVPETHPIFGHALRNQAELDRLQGHVAAAERALREAIRHFEATEILPIDLAITRAELARIRFARAGGADARALLGQALPVMRASLLPQEVNRADAESLARKLGI